MFQRALSGSGGSDTIDLQYMSFSLPSGTGLNITNLPKKPKGIIFHYTSEYILYAIDGMNNNKLYANDSDNGQTVTFGDTSITSTSGISGQNRTCYALIIY